MKRTTLSTVWNAALAMIAVSLLLVAGASATTTEKIIYNFSSLTGTFPLHGLAFDAAGNLYGTTTTGGAKDCGTVYQLTPGTNGPGRRNSW
ncbi:MAG: hypothetical protein H0X25_06485 [Acidobacteriales bacterium]|nr:hypothetical protein [Terriglobales bacterium]